MLVKNVMKKAMVIEEDISLNKASEIMSDKDISGLIMIKKNKVVGIVTHEDMVENFGKKKKFSDIMSKKVVVISPEEKTDKAIALIKEKGISILPVVDDKGNLVGVVSDKDLLEGACESEDFLLD